MSEGVLPPSGLLGRCSGFTTSLERGGPTPLGETVPPAITVVAPRSSSHSEMLHDQGTSVLGLLYLWTRL